MNPGIDSQVTPMYAPNLRAELRVHAAPRISIEDDTRHRNRGVYFHDNPSQLLL